MGMEEKGGSAWQQGKGGDTERRVRRKSWGSWQQTGETERWSQRGGARHLAIILGHLAEEGALGVPKAWGAPCGSQTSARPGWCGKRVSSCSPVLPPPPHRPVVFSFKVPKCLDFL